MKTASLKFNIPKSNVILETDDVNVCNGDFVEISADTWDLVIESASRITVCRNSARGLGDLQLLAPNKVLLNIEAIGFSRQAFTIKIKTNANGRYLQNAIAKLLDKPADDLTLRYNGLRIPPVDALSQLGVEDEDTIVVTLALRGGKPIIYVKSPDQIDVSLTLYLTTDWSFSAIYPVVPAKPWLQGGGQSVSWDVRTNHDGTLLEKRTGLVVSYLYWEAT